MSISSASTASEKLAQPTAFLHVAQAIELAVLLIAVVVLVKRWRERRNEATGWALALFGVLAAIVTVGFFPVKDDGSLLRHGYTVVLVCVLLGVPYFLVRFTTSLGALGRRGHRIAIALTALQVAATIVSPTFPEPGEKRTAWFSAYVLLIVVAWTVQSLMSAVGLWAAGRRQPSVVRLRMRSLSVGAMVVSFALVASAGSSQPNQALQVVTTTIGVAGICLLVLAFVLPTWLREAWRSKDVGNLAVAERGLMTAVSPLDVGETIVPALVKLFGARGATLLGLNGKPISAEGLTPEELAELRVQIAGVRRTEPVSLVDDDIFVTPLKEGWLVIQAGSFAPLFGPAELSLLERVGTFVDLALQRCLLYEQEAASRRAAEAANAELQTLVYSVSHDLRNPIISVLGYLDVLAQEHAGELQGRGQHYLDRISVNALYMQSLIQDLLELSRIGRSEPPPQAVPFAATAVSVAQEVRLQHPNCEVSITGEFPVVWMSEMRARQLLTNLVDNAAKHAQAEAKVSVTAQRGEDGAGLIFVADNGRGIAPAYREKAFEVFERLDAATSGIPGTGMGLPICKRIVESFGGEISIEGPLEGSPTGTTIRIVVPAGSIHGWSAADQMSTKENAR
jgi:signal transduction histidine kinase